MNKIAVFGDSFAAKMNTESSPTIDDFVKELFKVSKEGVADANTMGMFCSLAL